MKLPKPLSHTHSHQKRFVFEDESENWAQKEIKTSTTESQGDTRALLWSSADCSIQMIFYLKLWKKKKKVLKMLKKVLWGHIIYIWLRNVSPSNYTVHQAHPWNCYFLMDCQKRGFVYRESLSWTAFHSFLRLISTSASEGGRERSDSCPLHVATP